MNIWSSIIACPQTHHQAPCVNIHSSVLNPSTQSHAVAFQLVESLLANGLEHIYELYIYIYIYIVDDVLVISWV